jgi:hypothetical protein
MPDIFGARFGRAPGKAERFDDGGHNETGEQERREPDELLTGRQRRVGESEGGNEPGEEGGGVAREAAAIPGRDQDGQPERQIYSLIPDQPIQQGAYGGSCDDRDGNDGKLPRKRKPLARSPRRDSV